MNQPQQQRVVREITPQWEEIIMLSSQIKFGEIVLKVQNNEVVMVEYRITRRKGEETDGFQVLPL